ncbi:MAG TPA: flavodoxin family protein [Thermoplasmata archaeon]
MKVLAINGSPRRNGNTQIMLEEAAKPLRRARVAVEFASIMDYNIRPCNGCEVCYKKPWHCPIKDDALKMLKRMADADALLIGSPVYGADVTAQLRALLDRSIIPYINQDFKDKVGGAISVGEGSHGGQEFAVLQIMSFFAFHGMVVASPEGGLFGAMGTARNRGDIKKDKEGLKSARSLGSRMAELLKRMAQ